MPTKQRQAAHTVERRFAHGRAGWHTGGIKGAHCIKQQARAI